jgi:hypothetical protein
MQPGDVDAGLLKEATVDADLTELILNKNELLAVVSVSNKLLDQCCFACSQES